jgi:cob(I)alamin adenosyltransferase
MSISTKRGDTGKTSLTGGDRISKGALRVEAYGTIDELISSIGAARAICEDPEIAELSKNIQRELFHVSSAIAAAPGKKVSEIPNSLVDALTKEVHRLEKIDGILADWSIPGEHPVSASFDLARTVCRRAERETVRLVESGETVQPNVLSYLNRLSDLLWLFGRVLEVRSGIDASLRKKNQKGKRWSKAW